MSGRSCAGWCLWVPGSARGALTRRLRADAGARQGRRATRRPARFSSSSARPGPRARRAPSRPPRPPAARSTVRSVARGFHGPDLQVDAPGATWQAPRVRGYPLAQARARRVAQSARRVVSGPHGRNRTRALWQGQPGALHRAGRQGMCTRQRREHGHARTARTPPGAEPSWARCGRLQGAASLENWSRRVPVVRSAGASRATRHRAPRLCPPARHGHRRVGETKRLPAFRAHDRHGRMTPRVPQPLRVRVRLERSGVGPSGAGAAERNQGGRSEASTAPVPAPGYGAMGYLGVNFQVPATCNELRRRACTRG